MTAIAGVVAGCANEITVAHTDWDPHTQSRWTSVLAPMDAAGGERQTLLCRSDYYGRMQQCWDGHGIGTGQGFMTGGFAGLMQAGGFMGGMALLRPSPTNVSNSNTTSGGGSYIAPGAAAASSSANPVNTASGGAGGLGGAGGAGGRGGNAAASPTVTATASPRVSASGGAGGNATATGGNAAGGNATAAANPTATATGGNAVARSRQTQLQGSSGDDLIITTRGLVQSNPTQ
jgi:hypothetical protein